MKLIEINQKMYKKIISGEKSIKLLERIIIILLKKAILKQKTVDIAYIKMIELFEDFAKNKNKIIKAFYNEKIEPDKLYYQFMRNLMFIKDIMPDNGWGHQSSPFCYLEDAMSFKIHNRASWLYQEHLEYCYYTLRRYINNNKEVDKIIKHSYNYHINKKNYDIYYIRTILKNKKYENLKHVLYLLEHYRTDNKTNKKIFNYLKAKDMLYKFETIDNVNQTGFIRVRANDIHVIKYFFNKDKIYSYIDKDSPIYVHYNNEYDMNTATTYHLYYIKIHKINNG